MSESTLRQFIRERLLGRVQTPGQYIGGELGAVTKDRHAVAGRFCLAFPDTYSIGMSHHGLQVLYALMNARDDWACERVFAPLEDMERLLRDHDVPLWSLESCTPLHEFDVLGFTLQYDLCYSNVLTMLDLGRIPLHAADRGEDDPLVIAGGPCAINPEPMSRFIDLFVIGDGEEALPAVCDQWLRQRRGGLARADALAALAGELPFVYVPRFYGPVDAGKRPSAVARLRHDVPEAIVPAVVADLEAVPLPTQPIVPHVECVQDRITLEIMRGCPGRCRFCQSTTLKRPLRFRSVETLLAAARANYRHSGQNEISLLSLSTSDYPHLEELLRRLHEEFRPLGVGVSLPSLRINEELQLVGSLMNTDRHSGLTLAPEVARDDMRQLVGKAIRNDDLLAGCRRALERGFSRVKLYFMCGLPGERGDDLDGMVAMSEEISRLGKEVTGRWATVVTSVSNFVPKPQTPLQWQAMQRREYFHEAHRRLRAAKHGRSVQIKCHDVEASLLEGVLCRGDRRVGEAIERAWRAGARFDGWQERLRSDLWWQALEEAEIDIEATLHTPYSPEARLPWDHIGIRQGRAYLERERAAADEQGARMCEAAAGGG